jgi:hypothetical protein
MSPNQLNGYQNRPIYRAFLHGETGTRTRDTTIFSRVLYQLSYLAADRPSTLRCYWLNGGLRRLEFPHERVVGQPQPLCDRHLGPPPQLAFGQADVQAAVL